MKDRFDISRQWADAPEELERSLKGELATAKRMTRERNQRLIKLSVGHYYDPVEKVILAKTGSLYTLLNHDCSDVRVNEDKLRPIALDQGFKEVQGGFFWNTKLKHLYVKRGNRFVLYSLNRRKAGSGAVSVERRK